MKGEKVEGARPAGFGFIRFPWENRRWRRAKAKAQPAKDGSLVPPVPHEGPLLAEARKAMARIVGLSGQTPPQGEQFGEPEDRELVLKALRSEFHHLSPSDVGKIVAVADLPVPERCERAVHLWGTVENPGHVSPEMLHWSVVVVPEIVREALSIRRGAHGND